MPHVNVNDLKELRRRTAAGVLQCREALESTGGHMEQAVDYLRRKAVADAAARAAAQTGEGAVGSYIHHTGKLGAFVEVNCETDFVARTPEFQTLVTRLAEQVAATAPLAVERGGIAPELVAQKRAEYAAQARGAGKPEHMVDQIVAGKLEAFYRGAVLFDQPWVREPDKTVADLVKATASTLKEHLQVRRFARFRVGES